MIPYKKLHNKDSTCPCCYGTGVQYNKITGLNVICPCCGGTGKRKGVYPNYPQRKKGDIFISNPHHKWRT